MINNWDYEVKQLTIIDLPEISLIHVKAFKNSALTKLGIEPIRRYYASLLESTSENNNLGIYLKGTKLTGFCFSGNYSGSLTNFINQNKKFLIFWIFLHPWLIFTPMVINKIKMSIQIINKTYKPKLHHPRPQIKSFGILSIAVDPDFQGGGIGKRIMEYVEKEAINKGYLHMHLTVHPENFQAIQFYEQNGWKKKVKRMNNWNGFMEKTIDQNSKDD